MTGKMFEAAGYVRISKKEDGDISKSITNQIKIIEDFVSKNGEVNLAKIFVDDGITGRNMQRKGLQKMLKALKNKDFNCVLVKDFSRLGRDYIDVGNLIYNLFPAYGVRLVSIGDNYDSLREDNNCYLETAIKNIANDYYRKEVSKKVKITFNYKRSRGEYLGGIPAYGYKKEGMNIVVDTEVIPILEEVAVLRCKGISCEKIAEILNERNVDSPAVYLNKLYNKKIYNGNSNWSRYSIYKLLKRNLINNNEEF